MKTHNLTYALALVAAMILAAGTSMAQPSNTPAPERSGTLNAPAKFPIMAAGKEIGASTLPAGTKVAVIREEGGKTLVKASSGETWVESAAVAVEEQPQPAPGTNGNSPVNLVPDGKGGFIAAPSVAQPQPEPAAKPVPTAAAETKGKRVLLWARGLSRFTSSPLKTALEERGYTVETFSPTGYLSEYDGKGPIADSASYSKTTVPQLPVEELDKKAEGYDVVWLAYTYPCPEVAAIAKRLDKEKKRMILSTLAKDGAAALIAGDGKAVKEILDRSCNYNGVQPTEFGKMGTVVYFKEGSVQWGYKDKTKKETDEIASQIANENKGLSSAEKNALLIAATKHVKTEDRIANKKELLEFLQKAVAEWK